MTAPVLQCANLSKTYAQGELVVDVLKAVNFSVQAAEQVAIVGASGSGKSTLLNLLGGLDKPDTGWVKIQGNEFSTLSENARGLMRNRHLGFVYQFHHLLGEFTALENVCMPLLIAGVPQKSAQAQARDLLGQVGLLARIAHKPAELSGGERQRVAIARALANKPACVLMDEPTGNLDGKSAAAVQALMQRLSAELATAFVVVTHDLRFANTMNRVWQLTDGELNTVEVAV
ncbi:MAG TPA: ATP-binding cassette domain-containing protein [Cellvibrionaceae bacterium]|nr:ATP-binding cassette domain-containing protein [Cellvibrionaceae bacterium]